MSRFTLPSERSEALLYSKHLVSAAALLLSMVACSSATPTGDDAGAGGTGAGGTGAGGTGASGAALATGGSGGSLGGSSAGTSSAGGSGAGSGLTGGAGGTSAGGSVSFGGIPGAGGTSAAGRSGTGGGSGAGMGGTSAAAGAPSTGTGGVGSGTGGGTAAKCDNLSLAPSKTGVAAPTGAAGGLKVLDWAGFTGAVSFTFDDNTPSQLPDYNQLKATGAHFTWFVVGSWLSGNASTISGYKATIADGQELANHTYSHQSAGSESDLSKNESFIMTNLGVNANSMAAPNCDQSWSSVAPNVLFQNRGPCGNSAAAVSPRDSTSPFLLPAYLPNTGASAATLQGTFQTGKWRIFVIHGFDSQNGTYQPVPIDSVTTAMTAAVSGGYWTEGISNVGAYWQGQKLISASATTSATWTLPAHFPKNTCVRITTTGGTVTQSGKTIPWDPHGYYQISLDAGSVTVQ